MSDSDEKRISIYEKMCLDAIDSKPNMLIPWYIMASYAYYVQDDPLLSDGAFDRLVHRLLDSYNEPKCKKEETYMDTIDQPFI